MQWDPDTTLRCALWIGGGQWAGKSTVAGILAGQHGLTSYRYDYHEFRTHQDRQIAQRHRLGAAFAELDSETLWLRTPPAELAERAITKSYERFAWVKDDLRALMSPRPVLAEGCGLRPELVASVTASLQQMIVMVPTEDFRQHQLRNLPRAAFRHQVSDPHLAQRHRLERNRLVAEDAVKQARQLGVRVVEVDGTQDASVIAGVLSDYWQSFLIEHGG